MALWRRFLERTHFCTKNLTRNFLTQKSLYSQICCTKVGTSYKKRRLSSQNSRRTLFSPQFQWQMWSRPTYEHCGKSRCWSTQDYVCRGQLDIVGMTQDHSEKSGDQNKTTETGQGCRMARNVMRLKVIELTNSWTNKYRTNNSSKTAHGMNANI